MTSWRPYIGLCRRPPDVLHRRHLYEPTLLPRGAHVFMNVTFSPSGFMHYATKAMCSNMQHAPMLHKHRLRPEQIDYKAWHLHERLRVRLEKADNTLLVKCERVDISDEQAYE